MQVCNILLKKFEYFCKELYTCTSNITKKLSFLVEILNNVTLTKGW